MSLKNVVYIGLRSVDPAERQIAEQYDMLLYGMEDVDRHGIGRVMDMALAKVDPEGRRGIHVSFDIDALDALEVPSTGTPGNRIGLDWILNQIFSYLYILFPCSVRGGLSLREGLHIVERLHQTGRLEAIDMVEVNPAIGTADDVRKTVSAAIHLLAAACGTRRGGNLPRQRVADADTA